MEITLNLMGFTDFYYKEMLTSLISFSSRNTFSQTPELKSARETFFGSTCFIHFDVPCSYLHSFQKQPAANFFKHNCRFPDQEDPGHYINKSI